MRTRTRLALMVTATAVIYGLSLVEVTVSALSLAGLVAWGAFATALAWPAITRKDDR